MATNNVTKNIGPAQRAVNFANATRQNIHTLPKQSGGANDTLSWTLPKARLLSKIFLKVEAVFDAVSMTGNATMRHVHEIFSSISLDLNNGFSPFKISGEAINLLNGCALAETIVGDAADPGNSDWATLDTTAKKATFFIEMQNTVNDRDAVGLILLQNDSTYATLQVSVGSGKIGSGSTASVLQSVTITPIMETFSIPATSPDALPDLSVLKLCNSRLDAFPGSGENTIKLSTGTVYRKIILKLTDDAGAPLKLADITSDIRLIFNQADTNYAIDPAALRMINYRSYGHSMPEGVYVLDFGSSQGIPNLAGTRDYIDSERLTEMWIRFNTSKAGRALIITETLARLRA